MLTEYGPAPEPETVAVTAPPAEAETVAVTVTAADHEPTSVLPSDVEPAASDTGAGVEGGVRSATDPPRAPAIPTIVGGWQRITTAGRRR